jgi:hypothetical protein
MIRSHFSGAARQSIFLLLAIGFALIARFDSDSLHQSSEVQLKNVQGNSQKVDLTSFCPMLKNVNEGVSLHFKMSVPTDLNQYEVFSTSQREGGIRFFLNEGRQLFAVHGSSELLLSEPIIVDPLASSIFGGRIDLDMLVTMTLDPLYEEDQRVVFKVVNRKLQQTNAFMFVSEFNKIRCDDEGLMSVNAKNLPVTINARSYISPAAQEASRSTVLFRALVSLSFSFWLTIKWICRKSVVKGNHE